MERRAAAVIVSPEPAEKALMGAAASVADDDGFGAADARAGETAEDGRGTVVPLMGMGAGAEEDGIDEDGGAGGSEAVVGFLTEGKGGPLLSGTPEGALEGVASES